MKNIMKFFIAFLMTAISFGNINAQTLSFTYSPTSVNVGDEVTFTNTSTGFANTVRWVWNYGDICVLANAVNNTPEACNDTVIYDSTITKHTYAMNGFREVVLIALSSSGEQLDRISLYLLVERSTSITCVSNSCNYIANSDFAQDAPWANIPNACTGSGAAVTSGLEPTATIFNFQFLSCWDDIGFASYYYHCGNPILQVGHAGFWLNNNRDGCQWGDYHYQIPFTSPQDAYVGLGTLSEDIQFPGTWRPDRTYLHQQLPTALPVGQYHLKISVSLAERSGWATNGLQALLTTCPLSAPTAPNYLPVCNCAYQLVDIFGANVMNNSGDNPWQRYDIAFQTVNSYSHIYIGNFRKNPGDGNSPYGTPNLPQTVYSPHSDQCSWFNSCQAANQAFYYIDQVEIVRPITLNVTASPNPICLTNPLTPVTLNVTSNMTITSVQWSPSAGLSCATCATTTATPSVATTYAVTVTTVCGTATGTVTVTVNPASIASAWVNPPTCLNGAISLSSQASGGNGTPSFSWTGPNFYSSTQQNPTIISAATNMSGVYTVTVTYPNGCTATATTTVTVNPLPTITVSPSSTSICLGNPTTLTAGGAVSYSWSPMAGLSSSTGTSVTANPSTNTTYTVTGTDANGCTNSASATVTVIPVPFPFITGFQNNCEMLDLITYQPVNTNYQAQNPLGSSSYQWNVTGITAPGFPGFPFIGTTLPLNYQGSSFTNPPVGAEVCLTETATNGCTTTVCIPIYPCCPACGGVGGASVWINNLYASDVLNPSANSLFNFQPIMDYGNHILDPTLGPSVPNVVVNGNFIIDDDFTFEDCHAICFGANSRITVKPGHTLTIKYDTQPNSLWAGCGVMWDGIFLQDASAHLIITGNGTSSLGSYNAVIREAKNAIVSNEGGDFHVEFAEFLDCNRDIIVNAYSQPYHTGYVMGSWFHSSGTVSVPLLQWYPDYLQTQSVTLHSGLHRTQTAIEIRDVKFLTVGDGSGIVPGMQNLFEHIDCGIDARNSSLFSFNNRFQHIRQILTPQFFEPDGYCIYSLQNSNNGYSTTVGGLNFPEEPNFFEDADAGVHIQGGTIQLNNITHNTFSNVRSCIFSAHSNSKFTDIHINDNTLDNFWRGIYVQNNPLADIEIVNNTFNANYNVTQVSTAVTAADVGNAGPYVNIHDNIVNRVTTGILCTGERSFQYASDIVDNHIIFNTNHPSQWISYGIKLQNDNRTNVRNNEIYRCSNYIPILSDPHVSWPASTNCFPGTMYINKLHGISVETSSFTNIFNNMMGYLGNGMRCLNVNTQNYFNCNTMGYCKRGVSLLSSDAGQQGDQSKAADNEWRWNANYGFTPQWDVFGSLSPLNQKWYARGNHPFSANTTLITPQSPPTFYQILNPIGTANGDCSYPTPPARTPEELQSELAALIIKVLDPSCTLSEESKFMTLLEVYKELMYDSSLMNLGTQYDGYLQTFFDDATNSNIGEIANIRFLMGEEDYSNAENENSQLTPVNQSVQNEKNVNGIYLVTWARNIYTFTDQQSALLYSIAVQNPITGGTAVYDARVMLGIDLDDSGIEERIDNSANTADKYLRVYPNPARDEVNIDYNLDDNQMGLVVLYDMSGRELLRETLEGGMNIKTISTSMLSNGIYQVQLLADDNLIGNVKLAIMK
jgi:hypothetical protein